MEYLKLSLSGADNGKAACQTLAMDDVLAAMIHVQFSAGFFLSSIIIDVPLVFWLNKTARVDRVQRDVEVSWASQDKFNYELTHY